MSSQSAETGTAQASPTQQPLPEKKAQDLSEVLRDIFRKNASYCLIIKSGKNEQYYRSFLVGQDVADALLISIPTDPQGLELQKIFERNEGGK